MRRDYLAQLGFGAGELRLDLGDEWRDGAEAVRARLVLEFFGDGAERGGAEVGGACL